VAIPMVDEMDSPSISAAAAVFLYEVNWQRDNG
jgi:tRNA G18 (ribose-2'-O)-methylase SpoU